MGGGMEGGGPTLQRRRLGRALRSLRELAGLTGDKAGQAIERSGSWISRVEAGRVGLRTRDLKDLFDLYNLQDPERRSELETWAREGKQRGWWSKYGDVINEGYATLIGLETEARALRTYENAVIPGLLQTEDYCRAIIHLYAPSITPTETIEARVEVRMSRQARVGESRPDMRFVLDEAVLRRPIGGRRTLRNQIIRLIAIANAPNVDLRIMPFGVDSYFVAKTSFAIMMFRQDDLEIVYQETYTGGVFEDRPHETAPYREVFDRIATVALDPVASVVFLEKILGRRA
jgi:transcriptional regulator with XRE-family HTH domain